MSTNKNIYDEPHFTTYTLPTQRNNRCQSRPYKDSEAGWQGRRKVDVQTDVDSFRQTKNTKKKKKKRGSGKKEAVTAQLLCQHYKKFYIEKKKNREKLAVYQAGKNIYGKHPEQSVQDEPATHRQDIHTGPLPKNMNARTTRGGKWRFEWNQSPGGVGNPLSPIFVGVESGLGGCTITCLDMSSPTSP